MTAASVILLVVVLALARLVLVGVGLAAVVFIAYHVLRALGVLS